MNFNPRTHVGCDIEGDDLSFAYLISIHAPTWGATPVLKNFSKWTINFNPRTHVGCDFCKYIDSRQLCEFQSTHPRGVRRVFQEQDKGADNISIHAPTWGATPYSSSNAGWVFTFQSTHPRGVRRRGCQYGQQIFGISIHAPTWGATREKQTLTLNVIYFNPRTHVGCDLVSSCFILKARISIHAPTWGATFLRDVMNGIQEFQSTHPRGVRPQPTNQYAVGLTFQSTHPRGVRLKKIAYDPWAI